MVVVPLWVRRRRTRVHPAFTQRDRATAALSSDSTSPCKTTVLRTKYHRPRDNKG
ncbi:hypothetical protein HSR121_0274 [Halapricum desulfuricans]|uniref:Uncharacterized protein n=1 Tax=Halapricum desulfuricans TaxID=2841257 RepID=A0A897MR52_9EURY|nr:hypothetical protein HSR121_0274 [Halapricum desulfuricans]